MRRENFSNLKDKLLPTRNNSKEDYRYGVFEKVYFHHIPRYYLKLGCLECI